MHCQVRSADRTFFDDEATMVVARSTRGDFAVMDDHAPLLATLHSGPLRVKTTHGESVFACFGGSLRVSDGGKVTILVEHAVPVEEIDTEAPEAKGENSSTDATGEVSDERRVLLRQIKETYG